MKTFSRTKTRVADNDRQKSKSKSKTKTILKEFLDMNQSFARVQKRRIDSATVVRRHLN
jgi:hypothetical protein